MTRIFALMLLCTTPLVSFAQEQSHIDAAKELLVLTHADQVIQQTYAQVTPYFQQLVTNENLDEGRKEIVDRYFVKIMDALMEEMNWAKMEPLMVDAYVHVYTEEELRAASLFYDSPIGQKFVTKAPEMTEESMRIAMQLLEEFTPRMQEYQVELRNELNAYTEMKKAHPDEAE